MYPRVEYEMTEEDLNKILDACRPVPIIMIGNYTPSSQQENSNMAWKALGEKMGFDYMTVRPVSDKGDRFFTAVPSETEGQRKERLEKEAEENRQIEINKLEKEIAERKDKLDRLNKKEK